MKTLLFTAAMLFSCISATSQTTFQKTLDLGQDDEFLCGIPTTDGGYISCGYSASTPFGGLAVKMSSTGAVQWSKTVGGTKISHVVQTSWGGYYCAGGNVVSSNFQFYLTKLDGAGNILWSKSYGKVAEPDELHSLARTPDGGLIMSGYADTLNGVGFKPIAYVVKVDSNGVLQWSKYIGGTQGEEFYAAKPVSTGGYICAGYTASYSSGVGTESYLVRLDNSGNVLWAKAFGHNTRFDRVYDIVEFPGQGFFVTGQGLYTGTVDNLLLAKVDTSGNFIWQKYYGEFNGAWSLIKTADNKLLMGGYYIDQTMGLYNDSYLIKTDTSGGILWSRQYGGSGVDDKLWNVAETPDAGFFISGSNYGATNGRSSWFVKTNSLGQSGCRDSAVTITVATLPILTYSGGNSNSEYYASSFTVGQMTANMTSNVFCSGPTDVEEFSISDFRFSIWPNPVSDVLNVAVEESCEMTIVDMQGRVVRRGELGVGRNEVNMESIAEGIYTMMLTGVNATSTKKLVINR